MSEVGPRPHPSSTVSQLLRFQASGALRQDSFYIERDADEDLPRLLLAGHYCHVLAPRQIGKSSLRVRTEDRLRQDGLLALAVDLNSFGGGHGITEEQWCFSLCRSISEGSGRDRAEFESYWERAARQTPSDRWVGYLRDVLLAREERRVVLFIDEIDEVITLRDEIRDNFFAAVRALFNGRASHRDLGRLTFCILGTAHPDDLIANPARTPFNISRPIRLDDLRPEQVRPLAAGLIDQHDPEGLIERAFFWTSGHPAMMQRLCLRLQEQVPTQAAQPVKDRVDAIVHQVFLKVIEQTPILPEMSRKLRAANENMRTAQMLDVYRQLLRAPDLRIPIREMREVEYCLRLVGLVSEYTDDEGHWLQVRNRIVATVFNEGWVESRETDRAIRLPLARWQGAQQAPEHLLRGFALERALHWQQRQGQNVSATEREFIAASQEAARRRAQRWLVVALVLVAIVGPLTYLYVRAENREEAQRQEPYRKLTKMYAQMETIRADSETSIRVPELEPKARAEAVELCRGGDGELPDALLTREMDRIAKQQILTHACVLAASAQPDAPSTEDELLTRDCLLDAVRHAEKAQEGIRQLAQDDSVARDWLATNRTRDRVGYLLAMAYSLRGHYEKDPTLSPAELAVAREALFQKARETLNQVSERYRADFPPTRTIQLSWALAKPARAPAR